VVELLAARPAIFLIAASCVHQHASLPFSPYPSRRAAVIPVGCVRPRDLSRPNQEFIMSMHLYRGFEIYPLIYPHVPSQNGNPHNYDGGFDAAVKICQRGTADTVTRSETFRLLGNAPFESAGEARRASLRYAEEIIDGNRGEQPLFANSH
jgi:hypothetical protein